MSRVRAWGTVTVLVFISFVAFPVTVLAHAELVSSTPAPGSELSTAPGVVTLSFSEPLNVQLSSASVIAPDGTRFESTASTGQTFRIPLTTNAPGVYRVEWSTVSTLDGHPVRGSFAFGVGVHPGAGAESELGATPTGSAFLVAILRVVEDVALLASAGMLVLGWLARRRPGLPWARPRLRKPLMTALCGGIIVTFTEAWVAPAHSSLGSVASYLTTGLPGAARLVRVGAEGVGVLAAFSAVDLVAIPVVVAMAALAATGHAAAVRPEWLGISVQTLHLLSVASWAGAILALALLRPPDGWGRGEGRDLIDRFSPVALVSFLATIATGTLRGFEELSSPADLFGTAYGQVLLVKIAAVLVMVQLSLLAWRRLVGSPRAEAIIAVVVVAAAGLLAAFPLPPARVAEADAATQAIGGRSGLPARGDLTLGGEAGQVLVGLSLNPGLPGRNDVTVYVLPSEGPQAAAALAVTLRMPGGSLAMRDCGSTCRMAEVELQGGEDVSVTVDGPTGGAASFHIPQLPAAPAGQVLRRVNAVMHGLNAYRMSEHLTSGIPPGLDATYAFRAPNRARIEVGGS
ncbi:MAG: copper resistance protein CopC/CopD, partial [Actinomycetota bacterium]|nr:copper resistance protein CopC/CopD [Actinomycetota bacterium]